MFCICFQPGMAALKGRLIKKTQRHSKYKRAQIKRQFSISMHSTSGQAKEKLCFKLLTNKYLLKWQETLGRKEQKWILLNSSHLQLRNFNFFLTEMQNMKTQRGNCFSYSGIKSDRELVLPKDFSRAGQPTPACLLL